MNIVSFSFQGADVRTVTLANGEPGFVGKDVCDRLGYANPSDAMSRHCKGVGIRYPLQTAGGMQQMRILTEADVLRLIVSSTLPEAVEFERWVFEEVLPSIRKTGRYAATAQPVSAVANEVVQLQLALLSAQMSSDILRLDGVARLAIVHKAHDVAGVPHLRAMLPEYAVNSPDASSASSEPDDSLTEILKRNGSPLSARAANERLEAMGVIEQLQRNSSKGPKNFWSVTEKGLKFGRNAVHVSNPNETSPRWYRSREADLLKLLDAASLF